jgi:hypothetical protein
MKKNLGTVFGLPHLGMAAAFVAFCTFASGSLADVIVNNTGNPSTTLSGNTVAQVFTMGGTSGDLTSLTLTLNSVNLGGGSATVELYNTDGTAPTTSAGVLGTVTTFAAGNPVNTVVSLSGNPLLTAGGTYAIVLDYPATPPSSLSWDKTTTAGSGGDGSLGGLYIDNGGGNWILFSGNFLQMDLQTTPVPEVPVTGAVMGFGVLAIAIGHTLRRKLRLAVSSNA